MILGKSARTLQRMAESGDLVPAQKLPGPNGAYLFRRGDVLDLRDRLDAERTAAVSA